MGSDINEDWTPNQYMVNGWLSDSVRGTVWFENTEIQKNGLVMYTAVLPGKYEIKLETNAKALTILITDYIRPILRSIGDYKIPDRSGDL